MSLKLSPLLQGGAVHFRSSEISSHPPPNSSSLLKKDPPEILHNVKVSLHSIAGETTNIILAKNRTEVHHILYLQLYNFLRLVFTIYGCRIHFQL